MFLIVTRNFPPDVGGIQVLIGNLSKSLLDHGPVKVFAYEHQDSDLYDKKSLINIERVKGIKLLRKYRKARLVNNFIKKNSNIRAVFADHWKSLELINQNFLNKSKIFCLIHGKEINHQKDSSINKRIIKSTNKANFIIANSNYTKELAITLGINSSKIHVINPGINEAKSINNNLKAEAYKLFKDSYPKIITIGRLEKRKSHDHVLMSIRNLKNKYPKIKYISIGSGDEENKLKQLCKELSIEKEVFFLKNIDEDFKFALLNASNLFLMPSRIDKGSVEGFGISYIEAASYSVGSIGGKDGGASDAILNKETGLICDGNNLNSIYDSIIFFFKDNNFKKYGEAAKNYSTKFYWKDIVKKYLSLIN